MNPDQLRVKMCLSKKRMSHAEAEATARKFVRNDAGKFKGKRKKYHQTMVAYECPFCGKHHIGHQNFKGGYDPAKQFRDKERRKDTGG